MSEGAKFWREKNFGGRKTLEGETIIFLQTHCPFEGGAYVYLEVHTKRRGLGGSVGESSP